MVNPEFIEESALSLAEVKSILTKVEKRDPELNYRTGKAKEFLQNVTLLNATKSNDLRKKLTDLKLTRLKPEHICKIVDFVPKDANDLRVLLQSYPLSLPKKDIEAIIGVIKEFL